MYAILLAFHFISCRFILKDFVRCCLHHFRTHVYLLNEKKEEMLLQNCGHGEKSLETI